MRPQVRNPLSFLTAGKCNTFSLYYIEKTRVQTRQTLSVQNPLGHKKSGVSAALRAYCDMERAHTSFYIFISFQYRGIPFPPRFSRPNPPYPGVSRSYAFVTRIVLLYTIRLAWGRLSGRAPPHRSR